jgi:hypothetical protein
MRCEMPAIAPVERLITEVAAAGGVIRRAGDKIELMAPQPLPADLVARIREAKLALLAILAEAPDWRDLYEERAAIREYDGGYSRPEAERLAWGEIQNRWHAQHRGPARPEICGGCRQPIGEAKALDLIDGDRVHVDTANACLIRYGITWRTEATRALMALGLMPPSDREEDGV